MIWRSFSSKQYPGNNIYISGINTGLYDLQYAFGI